MSVSELLSRICARRARSGLAAAAVVMAAGLGPAGAGQPASCRLLQPAELESALGGKTAGLQRANLGPADACTGQVGTRTVLIRVAERRGDREGAVERQGIEVARKQGIQVDVKTEGDLTCSTMVPPASLAQMGFNTTCSIFRGGRVVAVEVTARSRDEMASMQVVRGLVEKAWSRL
jgi:hypothetical protein